MCTRGRTRLLCPPYDAPIYRRMTDTGTIFREAIGADMPGIARVRFSVIENVFTPEQLAQRGITNETIAASFLADCKGWVALRGDEIVGFAIADRASASIFALFVLPALEGQGIGSRLLELAVAWLRENGVACVSLTTGPETRPLGFYEKRGWKRTDMDDTGIVCLERQL